MGLLLVHALDALGKIDDLAIHLPTWVSMPQLFLLFEGLIDVEYLNFLFSGWSGMVDSFMNNMHGCVPGSQLSIADVLLGVFPVTVTIHLVHQE